MFEELTSATTKEETTMSFDANKPYQVGNSYYSSSRCSNLEDALRDAREQSASERKDVAIFKAVQLVKFPEVKAEDLKTEKLS